MNCNSCFGSYFRKQLVPNKTIPESGIHSSSEYTEIDPHFANTRNGNVYSEIGQLDVRRLLHADSVDTGYSDACSVQGIVDSYTCDINPSGHENLQYENTVPESYGKEVNCSAQYNKYNNVDRTNGEVDNTLNTNWTDGNFSSRSVFGNRHPPATVKFAAQNNGYLRQVDSIKFITDSIESGETIMTDNDSLYNAEHDKIS